MPGGMADTGGHLLGPSLRARYYQAPPGEVRGERGLTLMPSFLVNTSGKLPVFARPQQFWGADCPRKHESSRRISCADPAPQHA